MVCCTAQYQTPSPQPCAIWFLRLLKPCSAQAVSVLLCTCVHDSGGSLFLFDSSMRKCRYVLQYPHTMIHCTHTLAAWMTIPQYFYSSSSSRRKHPPPPNKSLSSGSGSWLTCSCSCTSIHHITSHAGRHTCG